MYSKASYFRTNALLRGFEREVLDELTQRSRQVRVSRREAVWSEDEDADEAFWIRSGVVKVACTSGGRELTLRFHTKGELIGEGSALAGLPRHTTALPYEGDATVFATPSSELRRLVRHLPELGLRLSVLSASRARRVERRLGMLPFRPAQARLAALFLELIEEFGVRDSRGVIINLRLTHKEMASLIGATRETVSFSIVELRRGGSILTESRRVVVLDPAALRSIATGG